MRKIFCVCAFVFFGGAAQTLAISIPKKPSLPMVQGIRVGPQGTQNIRFVLDLTAPISYAEDLLLKQQNSKTIEVFVRRLRWPERLSLIQSKSSPLLQQASKIPKSGHALTSIGFRKNPGGGALLVLNADKTLHVEKIFTLPPNDNRPHRLVLDVRLADYTPPATPSASRNLGGHFVPPSKPTIASSPTLIDFKPTSAARLRVIIPAQKPKRKTVVIDAGHGGFDPGAVGRSGIFEKNLCLLVAKEIQAQIQAQGLYDARLTRDQDISLGLRERFAKARQVKADLFISLHADSNTNKKVRGLSVYTLSETASDGEAAHLAKKENKADILTDLDFKTHEPQATNILIDLSQRDTLNQSTRFAAKLLQFVGTSEKLSHNTHRFADFAVLKAPDVPSVLIELGYISNQEDERKLKQPAYQKKLASIIVKAIHDYFQ